MHSIITITVTAALAAVFVFRDFNYGKVFIASITSECSTVSTSGNKKQTQYCCYFHLRRIGIFITA